MNYNIRGEQLDVTPALREHVEKKLGRLEKYFDNMDNTDCHVTLRVIRDEQIVEVTIPLKGLILRAEESHGDMYAAIDLVVEKLERQIRKYKTKVNRKNRQNGSIKEMNEEIRLDRDLAEGEDAGEDEFEIVRTKRFNLKPMDAEEAILQMDMLGHNFFVFSNADTDQVNVVYRRKDGKYGLIEPE
ncbi:MAG: ribosome-associated translation inhibitor RaiA [Bacillaceae bacterium]|nr:ribosome-associated translation inhibitor RaiA [Bacillaceae bacterium]